MPSKKDPRLARAGVSGFNKPKRTPNHPKKSHVVVAKEGDKILPYPENRTKITQLEAFDFLAKDFKDRYEKVKKRANLQKNP